MYTKIAWSVHKMTLCNSERFDTRKTDRPYVTGSYTGGGWDDILISLHYTARNITDLLQAVDFTELAQAVNIK